MNPDDVVLELRGVFKTFRAGKMRVEALKGVSLTVPRGSFVAVVGASGSGKTTMLRIMGGLEIPDRGEVLLRPASQGCPRHPVGMVFQEHRLFPWLTVLQNVAFPLEGTMPRREASIRAMESLEMVGLSRFAGAKPKELSGGMAQRAALARALAFHPEVVLMDEPLGALDYFTRRELQLKLQEILLNMKKTFVMVTHDVDEAVFLADRVAVLREGGLEGVLDVPLPRPRGLDLPEVVLLRRRVLNMIGG
ncbi:ABC-type nitrate/sulfonate/bicarbonate transport system, ATPase component [Thermanaerovibrio velox DSM 12556]|uniref:ABC-type nitrate/sulfonate/bicarbonate transport system, ATPase component n=1 Tax=Thermanaerovibrio velox DSM 12556 TaxID=926567 RepID=H0UQC2_9BACT|nr:ABC transporter ATP-binding protein [Thermanaerovibrio velox]EHM10760.1 ABC-type nitrate/sulfonate/bicarbonate transport system, ATPase component [Thermanaerovibrio velox DSM 12556]